MWSQNNYTAHPASLLSKLLLLANPKKVCCLLLREKNKSLNQLQWAILPRDLNYFS